MPDDTPQPTRKRRLTQDVYTNVDEAHRPGLIARLWSQDAIKVEAVLQTNGTFTVTATFEEAAAET